MPDVFWFLVGVASSIAVTLLVVSLRRAPGVDAAEDPPPSRPSPLERSERAELELTRGLLAEAAQDLESLARGLGDDLATMSSAIEGHSQLLCEAMGEPRLVAHRAEHLWKSVRRLRTFSEKILSFAEADPNLPLGPTDVRPALQNLAYDLQDAGAPLHVEIATSDFLPLVTANDRGLRHALMFLTETLLSMEPRASRLYLRAFPKVYDDQATRVEIEISAEAEDAGPPHEAAKDSVQFGYVAARNLLEAQGARLSFDELEGLSVTCFVSLIAADEAAVVGRRSPTWNTPGATLDDAGVNPEPVADIPRPPRTIEQVLTPPTEPPHRFSGVLILENDPELREMLAHELGPTGRKLVTCVDGAAARSLIEATPERFEVAILEQDARIEPGDDIARLIRERSPDTKILLLATPHRRPKLLAEADDNLRAIRKPFGIHELRDALRDLVESPASPG